MASRRERKLRDIEQDIREHIEIETQDNIGRGMSPEEARRAAMLKFGNIRRVKEDTREVWSWVWLEQFVQDIRYAVERFGNLPASPSSRYSRSRSASARTPRCSAS